MGESTYFNTTPFAYLSTAGAQAQAASMIDVLALNADDAFEEAKAMIQSIAQLAYFDPVDTNIDWTPLSHPSNQYNIGDLPTKPVLDEIPEPPSNFTYIETPYVSALLDALKAKLLNDILNGGTGLTLAVENEIYARESERDLRTVGDTIDRIATRWSESGFVLPDGVLAAMTSWADIEYQNRYSDKSRKIAEDSFKMAVENTRFTVEQSSKLEEVLMQFNTASNKNKLDAAMAILEAGIKIFNALVAEQLSKVELYKAEAQAYEANAKAVSAIAQVDVAYFDAETKYNSAKAEADLKEIEMQIKQLEVKLSLQSDLAKAIADVGSRIAVGALSAINAGVSFGYQGHDQNSFSNQHSNLYSNSYNRNDNYNHDEG